MCVCDRTETVCVCVRERERQRECVCDKTDISLHTIAQLYIIFFHRLHIHEDIHVHVHIQILYSNHVQVCVCIHIGISADNDKAGRASRSLVWPAKPILPLPFYIPSLAGQTTGTHTR